MFADGAYDRTRPRHVLAELAQADAAAAARGRAEQQPHALGRKDLEDRIDDRRLADARAPGDHQRLGGQRLPDLRLLTVGKLQPTALLDPRYGRRFVDPWPGEPAARLHRDDAGGGTFRGVVASSLRRRRPGEDAAAPTVVGVRHGHRERTLTGTFGKTRIAVPRARLTGEDGKTREWRSGSLRAYQRRTRAADALIAGAYLAGTNTRRVRRALNAVFAGPVGKDGGQPRLAQDEGRLGRRTASLPDSAFNDDHLGTLDAVRGAVHPINKGPDRSRSSGRLPPAAPCAERSSGADVLRASRIAAS